MKENKLVDLSKQFAVDVVNLCTEIKEKRKGRRKGKERRRREGKERGGKRKGGGKEEGRMEENVIFS